MSSVSCVSCMSCVSVKCRIACIRRVCSVICVRLDIWVSGVRFVFQFMCVSSVKSCSLSVKCGVSNLPPNMFHHMATLDQMIDLYVNNVAGCMWWYEV